MIDVTPSIKLSNGHQFSWMVASGALWFDGKGWPFPMIERPLASIGAIDTRRFTIVIKTVTKEPRVGNLKRWSPWTCILPIPGGWINKVGLTNGGIHWWERSVAPTINWNKMDLVASIQCDNVAEAVYLTNRFNHYPFKAHEYNISCPNSGDANDDVKKALSIISACRDNTSCPGIAKLGAAQPYLEIARGIAENGLCEAISFNTVPWENYAPHEKSPLWRLQQRLRTNGVPNGAGGGGISGLVAQALNWKMMQDIVADPVAGTIPVIGPSVWRYDDMEKLMQMGAKAISFGSIHIARPLAPTQYTDRWGRRKVLGRFNPGAVSDTTFTQQPV